MPVILLSDALWWLIIVVLFILVLQAQKNSQTRQKWQRIFAKPLTTVCAVFFFFYAFVASLDSIHFKTNTNNNQSHANVISVVDLLLSNLTQTKQLSYSSPLASELHSKMTIKNDGIAKRENLPLKKADEQTAINFSLSILWGIIIGLMITALLLIPIHIGTKKWDWQTRKHAYYTLGFLICANAILLSLSEYVHIFGTDKIGNDVFYDAIKGIRTAMLLGTLTTLVLLPLALLSGISAGFYGGIIDDIIQYIYTTLNSVPGVLLIASSVLLLQGFIDRNPEWFAQQIIRSDTRLVLLCMVLGLTSWTGLCRLLRAETLKLKSLEYVDASRALGVSSFDILKKHILPNVTHIVLIVIVLDFSGLILAEAVLSYIGVGVDPTMPSWGNMINSARFEISKEPVVWWPLVATFLLMFTLVLITNLFADRVRQVFDPRQ
jgi:peptide/nickel transport system permease protein